MIAWVERHRTTVAYVILALGVSLALWQNRLDAEARTAQAKAAVEAQARTALVDHDRPSLGGVRHEQSAHATCPFTPVSPETVLAARRTRRNTAPTLRASTQCFRPS